MISIVIKEPLMDYNKYDLIITTNHNKLDILESFSVQKRFLKPKIMTLNEFINNYYGSVSKKAYKILMTHFKVSVYVVDTWIKNAMFIPEVWQFLKDRDLIIYNPSFRKKYSKILAIDVLIDPYILKDVTITNYSINSKLQKNSIYEFVSLDDELEFVASRIKELLKNVDISNIRLVNVTKEMRFALVRTFSMMGIPVLLNTFQSLYGISEMKEFMHLLNSVGIEKSINKIDNLDIRNKIIDIINEYEINQFNNEDKEILKFVLEHTEIPQKEYQDIVRCVDYQDISNDGKYYFILGLNEGVLPQIFKDNDYFSDIEKEKYGLNTSSDINTYNSDLLIKKIKYVSNVIATYHLKTYFAEFSPSHIIEDYDLDVVKDYKIKNCYSDTYNILQYAKKMDKLVKYNVRDNDLEDYYITYKESSYKTYNNAFKGLEREKLYKYLNNKLLLSYSSLDNYFHCAFKYYIKNILKLDSSEETSAMLIGSLFHHCLSKMYNAEFDFEKEYNGFLKDKKLSIDESFFAQKLKKDLLFVIETIKKQDLHSSLTKTLTEHQVYVDLSNDVTVSFIGIIDKIRYDEKDNQKVLAIIDYKTGNLETNLDNICYGFHMQLPIYIYLTKKSFSNVSIAGFYLQKILNNQTIGETQNDRVNKLKLDGFSNSNMNIIGLFDNSYTNSEIIKSLKVSSKGWYNYSKVLDDNQVDFVYRSTEKLILDTRDKILNADFTINPKRIGAELEGCKYCTYSDICFKKEEDIVDLAYLKFKDIIEGDNNA